MKLTVYILGVIAALAFVLGYTFKVLHFPGADELVMLFAVASFLFIPLYAIYRYKKN